MLYIPDIVKTAFTPLSEFLARLQPGAPAGQKSLFTAGGFVV